MARNQSASGYESVAGSLWAPPKIAAKIVYNYHICSITPMLAKSNFLSDEDLFCGSKVIFGVEQDLDMFGSDTDNNESPETHSGPGIDSASLQICQSKKFEWKISNQDKRMMCDNYDRWEANLRRQISKNITKLVDAYSIPKIIASASPDNVGLTAGMLTHSTSLGNQGSGALAGNTVNGFEDMILALRTVAQEAGMLCGEGEIAGEGDGAKPVILIPLQLEKWALKFLRENGKLCCTEDSVLRTGLLGEVYGFQLVSTRWLIPRDFGASGILAPVVLVDPNQVLHAFDVITNKWWEGKFEDFLVGEFVWDTHVFNPHGIAVAISKV
jgi:hypothetical protein